MPASARAAADAKGGKNSSGSGKPAPPPGRPASGSKVSQQQGSKQDWLSLARYLEREGLMPTVVFSFSKKVGAV